MNETSVSTNPIEFNRVILLAKLGESNRSEMANGVITRK